MSARSRRKIRAATAVVRLVISLGTAPTRQGLVRLEPAEVVEGMEVEAKIATSVVKLVTLHATALRVVPKAAMAVDMAEGMEAVAADMAAHDKVRLATPAVATATCLATALRARNATIVSIVSLWLTMPLLMHFRR